MQPESTTTFRSQLHYPHVAYEERVFTLIFLCVLLVGLLGAQYFQGVRIQRPVHIPKPEAKKVAEIILREPEPPKPIVKPTPPKPPPPRKLTKTEKKKLTSPPPLSAVGSPKAMPKKKVDVKKMVARKGLLGMLSKESKDSSLRAYHPSKKRDVSKELDQALKNLSKTERKAVIDRLNRGRVKVLVATGQLIGEGFDCKCLSTLFLATPIRYDGRVIQYLGRVLRPAYGKERAKIYDYVDANVGVLAASAKARQKVYTQGGFYHD